MNANNLYKVSVVALVLVVFAAIILLTGLAANDLLVKAAWIAAVAGLVIGAVVAVLLFRQPGNEFSNNRLLVLAAVLAIAICFIFELAVAGLEGKHDVPTGFLYLTGGTALLWMLMFGILVVYRKFKLLQ